MLPIYNVIIDNETGIDRISLVEMPAVESNFLAFSQEKKQVMFSANEEKQMITGVVMRADFPIYRYDMQHGEYYVQFSKETIRQMAEKLLSDNNQNRVNIEHIENSDVEGVCMQEMFIKDIEKGINPTGFEEISNGSLFATFKVHNPHIWERIKCGDFKGFSLEGMFVFEEVKDEEEQVFNEIMEMLDKIMNKKR